MSARNLDKRIAEIQHCFGSWASLQFFYPSLPFVKRWIMKYKGMKKRIPSALLLEIDGILMYSFFFYSAALHTTMKGYVMYALSLPIVT